MNRGNIEKLIGVLAALPPESFDMEIWPNLTVLRGMEPACGTAACIGGWCNWLMGAEGLQTCVHEYLGISGDMRCVLTNPSEQNNLEGIAFSGPEKVTIPMAIKALRNILAGCEPRNVWDGCRGLGNETISIAEAVPLDIEFVGAAPVMEEPR